MSLSNKVDIDRVGLHSASKAYGGYLNAYSFHHTTFEEWFNEFRSIILSKMGKEYFPVYRLADGEFRFLMGRKFDWYRKPLVKELIAVTAERLRIKNPDKWKTSWGEEYSPKRTKFLRKELIKNIEYISKIGVLAAYYNTNGLHAFEEYNKYLIPFFENNNIKFNRENYYPFHFVCGVLVKEGWQDFIENKTILIVTGSDDASERKIEKTLKVMAAKTVLFCRISKTSSMEDKLNLKGYLDKNIDICLVAAGIGSANILRQLEPLKTVALDIGGYMKCFIDYSASQHGGIFRLPINI